VFLVRVNQIIKDAADSCRSSARRLAPCHARPEFPVDHSASNQISARLGQGIRLATPASGIQLNAEGTRLDVTNKRVTNCAIPCYFLACGIAGADPADTYKPCFQARMHIQQAEGASETGSLTAAIELRDAANLPQFDSLSDFTFYQQLPLYTKPNQPFPPGNYRLNGTLKRNGEDAGSASLPIRID
jgi:hypothetical protein